jgi:hypothetical protein
MEAAARDQLAMLTILHASCATALEMFTRSGGAQSDLAADLKRILERTRRELDTFAREDAPDNAQA